MKKPTTFGPLSSIDIEMPIPSDTLNSPMAWTSLCDLEELTPDQGKYVEIDGYHLAVFLAGGNISVIDSRCPHAGGNLSAGIVEDGCAVCPWHYWAFRLDNGELRGAPGVAVSRYESRLYDYQGRRVVQADLRRV